jgi:ferric-dicitrate binding protein FerR (iron transport regulator)
MLKIAGRLKKRWRRHVVRLERVRRPSKIGLAREASMWVLELEADTADELKLADWLARSPEHLKEFILAIAIHQQIRHMGAEYKKAHGGGEPIDASCGSE